MESAMETNKDAKVVSKKKQNIMYSEVKAISHIGKKKYGTDDFETNVFWQIGPDMDLFLPGLSRLPLLR